MTASARGGGAGRGIALTVAANVATLGIGLLTSVILARTLGPSGRGAYAAILTLPTVVSILGLLGVNQAAVYRAAREPGEARRIVSTGTLLGLAVLVPIVGVAWAAMPLALRAQAPETIRAARQFLLLYAVANAAWLVSTGVLQGLRLFGAWNGVRLAQPVLWLAVLLGAAWLVPGDPGRLSLLFAACLLAAVPLALAALGRGTTGSWSPSGALVRPMLRYGLLGWSAAVPIYLNRRLDQLALAAFVEPRLLGFYAVAANTSVLVSSVIASVANVALPHVAATAEADARRVAAQRYVRFAVVLGVACGGALLAVIPFLVPLVFGQGFTPAVAPALVLIPAAVLQGVATVAEDVLMGLDRARSVLLAEGVGLAVTVAGIAIALPRAPLVGTALALLLAAAVVLALALRACVQQVGGTVRELAIPTGDDWREAVATARRFLPGGR